MSFRGSASCLSVILSLGLIAAIVFGLADRFQERPAIAPAAVPASQKATAAPRPAPPKTAATEPVVLPPPPAPAPKPVPRTSVAQKKPSVAPPKQAPRPTESKKKPPSEENPRPTRRERPPPPAKAEARAPQPQIPEPAPKATRKPTQRASRDQARAARTTTLAERAATQPKGEAITATQEDVAEGRILLRLLEFGSGPSIELAWPDAAARRETLFTTLGRCFGMQVALMDAAGRLFIAVGRPNRPWNLNLDRFSGFIREPAGQLSKQEQRVVERIHAHHRDLVSGEPVRVFPRAVDARLLGGLRRLLGVGYAKARVIRARYRIDGRRLLVEQVVADGQMIQGRLEVPPITLGGCRRLAQT